MPRHLTTSPSASPWPRRAVCLSKHSIKQVDRLLSNQGIVVWDMFAPWVAEVVGQRKTIVVAMDWTDFDADDQTTLALGGESTRYGVEAASAAIARRRRRPRDRAGPDRPEWILVWSGWTCERSRDNVAAFAQILCALGPRRGGSTAPGRRSFWPNVVPVFVSRGPSSITV